MTINKLKSVINTCLLIALFQGCSFFLNSHENDLDQDHTVPLDRFQKSTLINKNFQLKNFKNISKKSPSMNEADVVFVNTNQNDRTRISINSNCKKNNLSTLDQLKNSILSGINHLQELSSTSIQIHGRDGIETLANGKIDGVNFYILLTIFQKDFCIYDLILLSKDLDQLKSHQPAYQKLTNEIFNF